MTTVKVFGRWKRMLLLAQETQEEQFSQRMICLLVFHRIYNRRTPPLDTLFPQRKLPLGSKRLWEKRKPKLSCRKIITATTLAYFWAFRREHLFHVEVPLSRSQDSQIMGYSFCQWRQSLVICSHWGKWSRNSNKCRTRFISTRPRILDFFMEKFEKNSHFLSQYNREEESFGPFSGYSITFDSSYGKSRIFFQHFRKCRLNISAQIPRRCGKSEKQ